MKNSSNPLQLNEIFYSFQGEGYHSGTPAVFIRAAGCNLKCDFCDTDFSLKFKKTTSEILDQILTYNCRFAVITGGEAALQAGAFRTLVTAMKNEGFYTTLETNGDFTDTLGVDWVTVSPKLSQQGSWKLRKGDELKLIYENQNLQDYLDSDFNHYFLQPKEIRTESWGGGVKDNFQSNRELKNTARTVLNNPPWKLSVQLHKQVGVR